MYFYKDIEIFGSCDHKIDSLATHETSGGLLCLFFLDQNAVMSRSCLRFVGLNAVSLLVTGTRNNGVWDRLHVCPRWFGAQAFPCRSYR